MGKEGILTFLGFAGIITIIVVLLNLPPVQIQTKEISELDVSYDNKINLYDVVVWNKGGTIGGNLFFVPNICIYASASDNISCTHNGYNSDNPCSNGICETINAGELSSKDNFHLVLPKDNLESFNFNITARGYVSFLTLASDKIFLDCKLNKTTEKYNCIEN
jgi:hypothetical protein